MGDFFVCLCYIFSVPNTMPRRRRNDAVHDYLNGQVSTTPPETLIINQQIEDLEINTSAEWIEQHTGMKKRYHAGPNMATSDLAIPAASRRSSTSST